MTRRLLILPLPDLPELSRAGAAFERAPSTETERALAAAVEAFSERAELLAIYAGRVGGKPRLS
jgi:hypothetical protein